MVPTTSAMLSGEVDLWMHNALRMSLARLRLVLARCVLTYHVTCQCVVARKGLLFNAQCAADLLLAPVVNRVLVPSEIVRPREDGVARLSGSGVDALTLVWACLRVSL
jgi:hypothetical protein